MRNLFTSVVMLCALSTLIFAQTLLGGGGGGKLLGGQGVVRRAAAGGGGSSLDTGLVSVWKLSEATDSATWVDSVGSNNLARDMAQTMNSVAGKVSTAADFTGNSSLSIADNAPLSPTSSISLTVWVKFSSLPGAGFYKTMINKADSSSTKSYFLWYVGDLVASNPMAFTVSADGAAETAVTANTFGVPSTGVWYFVAAYFDDTANTIGISVTSEAAGSLAAFDTVAFTGNIFDSSAVFYIGKSPFLSSTFSIGTLDTPTFHSRKLTTTEFGCLYNAGVGQEPPYATCP